MDLKTGKLLWPDRSRPLVRATPLGKDVDCDVLILGAGITGALSACLLARAGQRVVVVDRRGVAKGSTPASTALIQYEIDTPLVDLRRKVGRQSADLAYAGCRRAVEDLDHLIRELSIDCDLQPSCSLFLASKTLDLEWFGTEARARRELGIEAEFVCHQQLVSRFGIDRPGALHSSMAMGLDPYKLVHGLLEVAVSHGARVVADEMRPAESNGRPHRYFTLSGAHITATHVIVATGYETPEQYKPLRRYCSMKSTYALASQPLSSSPAWPGHPLIWEAASPYFYVRQTLDNRVIIGGEDDPFTTAEARDAVLPEKIETLVEKFRKLRPGVEITPEYYWAGTFGETRDGLPLIGQVPMYPGCHFALGYGGNGITFAYLAAEILRDQILGDAHPLAEVFKFDREPVASPSRQSRSYV